MTKPGLHLLTFSSGNHFPPKNRRLPLGTPWEGASLRDRWVGMGLILIHTRKSGWTATQFGSSFCVGIWNLLIWILTSKFPLGMTVKVTRYNPTSATMR